MTTNTSAFINETGVDLIRGLNAASGGKMFLAFLVVMVFLVFGWYKLRHDAVESWFYTSFFLVVLVGAYSWLEFWSAGEAGQGAVYISFAVLNWGISAWMHFSKGRGGRT